MEPLFLKPGEDTPRVILNKEKANFIIEGNSFPEDPFTIYSKIFSWLKYYNENPNEETDFEFKLNYINTASSKQIAEVLAMLEDLNNKSKVKIIWYYEDGDEDTLMEGKELEQMFKLNFEFREH